MTTPRLPLALLSTPQNSAASVQNLAASLQIPVVTNPQAARLLLRSTACGLELCKPGDSALPGSIRVDFASPDARRRLTAKGRELLIQAAKVRRSSEPLLIDTTAGLGSDGFLLAASGFRVLMFEINPVVSALLADGLKRAGQIPALATIVERIRLITGDAQTALAELSDQPEVIYLDPMFPERTKSALVKQELRLLQLLSPPARDPGQLLRAALLVQARKVVVKRPQTGPCLLNLPPSYTVRGKAIRFDVYVGTGKKKGLLKPETNQPKEAQKDALSKQEFREP